MILLALLAILLGTYAALGLVARRWGRDRLDPAFRGRASLALLFLFTGLGHFVKTDEMAAMLPAWMPMRVGIVYLTGMLEWAGAVGLLLPRWSRAAGLCLMLFLLAVFPANVHAALSRVAMGGHEMGPAYLLVRGPFQALLIWWAYWFAVRRPARA
jgi:uncharacterized membrane protein